MEYIDVHKAAEMWQTTERRVTALCREGRIVGAKKDGKLWLIPDDAPKPLDGRTKESAAATSDSTHSGELTTVSYKTEGAGMAAAEHFLSEDFYELCRGIAEKTLRMERQNRSKIKDKT